MGQHPVNTSLFGRSDPPLHSSRGVCPYSRIILEIAARREQFDVPLLIVTNTRSFTQILLTQKPLFPTCLDPRYCFISQHNMNLHYIVPNRTSLSLSRSNTVERTVAQSFFDRTYSSCRIPFTMSSSGNFEMPSFR